MSVLEKAPASTERLRERRVTRLLVGLVLLAVALITVFAVYDLKGAWQYALNLRLRQVGALVVVGVAIGVASVVFQTIAGNKVLTPGVMGFDSLYLLVQTLIVVFFGSGSFLALSEPELFVLNTIVLVAFGTLLFTALFRTASRDLFVLILVGMVAGTMFGSLTSLASRVLSPDDYLTVQDVMFASFSTADPVLLVVAGLVTAVAIGGLIVPRLRHLDVIELGRDPAVALGAGYRSTVLRMLVAVTILIAAATALVGPMTFLGLIVACLARQLMPTGRHTVLVPAAALVGVCATVGGQFAVVHLFGYATTLSVIVNLIGGVYFVILLRRAGRA